MSTDDPLLTHIRERVIEFITEVSSRERPVDPPTSTITEVQMSDKEDGGEFAKSFQTNTRGISHPSQKSGEHYDLVQDVFQDLAEVIAEQQDGHQIETEDEEEPITVPSEQMQVQRWLDILSTVAWKVMDYEGAYRFNDRSYRTVLRDHLLESGDEYASYQVIVPLLNVASTVDDLPLQVEESDVTPHRENPVVIRDLHVSEFTDGELSAVLTYEGYLTEPDPTNPDMYSGSVLSFNLPSHKIAIDIDSIYEVNFGIGRAAFDSDIASRQIQEKAQTVSERVVTALRLDDPESQADFGQPYHIIKDWRTYRDDIDSVDLYRSPMSGYDPSLWSPRKRGKNYELDDDTAESLQSFWQQYNTHLTIEGEAPFVSPLRRFNRVYDEIEYLDRLIDAVIAFETLLLKGPGLSSNRTRLALNGSFLLDGRLEYGREEVRTFFTNLYLARSEIVHRDRNWEEILADKDFEPIEEEPSITDFERKTRRMLAETILEYMDRYIDHGENIHQTNAGIYEAIRNADYPPSDSKDNT